jgi:hypothetical protein
VPEKVRHAGVAEPVDARDLKSLFSTVLKKSFGEEKGWHFRMLGVRAKGGIKGLFLC